MASKNDITGDSIKTKLGNSESNKNFSNGWDLIFKKSLREKKVENDNNIKKRQEANNKTRELL